MTKRACVSAILALLISAMNLASSHAAPLEHRWIYLPMNLMVDKNVDEGVALMERAAKAGYNGVVVGDNKFMRWDTVMDCYIPNVRRFRQACRDRKLACIACVCPIGYSNDLLSRDPNLAEGLPVVAAPFLAKDGRLVPSDDSARLLNGGFERWKNNMPTSWGYVDEPGGLLHRHGGAERRPGFAPHAGHRLEEPARAGPGLADHCGAAVPLLPRVGRRQDEGL